MSNLFDIGWNPIQANTWLDKVDTPWQHINSTGHNAQTTPGVQKFLEQIANDAAQNVLDLAAKEEGGQGMEKGIDIKQLNQHLHWYKKHNMHLEHKPSDEMDLMI